MDLLRTLQSIYRHEIEKTISHKQWKQAIQMSSQAKSQTNPSKANPTKMPGQAKIQFRSQVKAKNEAKTQAKKSQKPIQT